MRAHPQRGQSLGWVPSLIRRRNLSSGQTSFGFLALLPWRAQRLSGCDSTTLSSETAGHTVTCSATNGAGLPNSASVTIKLDKTGPAGVALAAAGTLGLNGWYTNNVTISTTGTDSISSPVVCTGLQSQTTETAGAVFNGSCTNNAGLTTNAAPLTVKLDKTPPTATLAVTAGTLGLNGWYTTDVTIRTTGTESISNPVA